MLNGENMKTSGHVVSDKLNMDDGSVMKRKIANSIAREKMPQRKK